MTRKSEHSAELPNPYSDVAVSPVALVHDFMTAFDTSRDPDLWEKLVNEEAAEVIEAGAALLKELADLTYVMAGYGLAYGDHEKLKNNPKVKSAALLVETFFQGFADVMPEAFLRVHQSNMSKLGDDGKPIRRDDGKILKGPNYKPPVLTDLVTKL